MNKEKELKRGTPIIKCPQCDLVAGRVGAQDYCDVYVCDNKHVTRVKVGTNQDAK